MAKLDMRLIGSDAAADQEPFNPNAAKPLAARMDETLDLVLRGITALNEQAAALSMRVEGYERNRK